MTAHHRRPSVVVLLGALAFAAVLATGCSSGSESGSPAASGRDASSTSTTASLPACGEARHLVASDIDETLTVSDAELIRSLREPGYQPEARPGGAEMMRGYAARGYTIAYVTGRPEGMEIGGRPAAEVTTAWLKERGFPLGPGVGMVYLWPTERYRDIRSYKAGTLKELRRQGYALDFAYGNADTDAQAYADSGFAPDRTFMIGKLAGYGATVPVKDPGWVQHRAAFVEDLPKVCRR